MTELGVGTRGVGHEAVRVDLSAQLDEPAGVLLTRVVEKAACAGSVVAERDRRKYQRESEVTASFPDSAARLQRRAERRRTQRAGHALKAAPVWLWPVDSKWYKLYGVDNS